MKSKFLIVSLALCLMVGGIAHAYDCGCNDVNPCNACNSCCNHKCDLFSGLKNLLKTKPCSLNACGPCDAVVACAPCEPVACVAPCEPVACVAPCEPVCAAPFAACEPVCGPIGCGDMGCGDVGCYDPCYGPRKDRPVLRAAKKTKHNVSKFFNGLFGSLKGCDCNLCASGCCDGGCNANACDPCCVAPMPCDPCAPACYSNAMPGSIPE